MAVFNYFHHLSTLCLSLFPTLSIFSIFIFFSSKSLETEIFSLVYSLLWAKVCITFYGFVTLMRWTLYSDAEIIWCMWIPELSSPDTVLPIWALDSKACLSPRCLHREDDTSSRPVPYPSPSQSCSVITTLVYLQLSDIKHSQWCSADVYVLYTPTQSHKHQHKPHTNFIHIVQTCVHWQSIALSLRQKAKSHWIILPWFLFPSACPLPLSSF